MRSLNAAEPQFPGDDGAADPAVRAALAAYAAGQGSEHAALDALASSRLLVPVVAVLTEEVSEAKGDDEATGDSAAADGEPAGDAADVPGSGLRQEKSTEMALPTLIGQDGRAAVLAFTSLDALTRWRADARPVAVPAARAWQAGTEEASAVVIDVAGPVPVTVEGARLAALAAGRPAPLPHQDPDVLAALHAALGNEPLIVQASLTTPDQRAGWEYGPRPEDLPELGVRSGPDLSALGLDLAGPASPGQNGASQNGAGQASAAQASAAQASAVQASAGQASAAQASAGRDSAGQDGAPDGSADGKDAAGTGSAGTSDISVAGAARDTAAPDAAAGQDGAGTDAAAADTADLALQVTLADGCDPAAATAAVRRVAEALLTATGGRLRRGMEVSVAPPRRTARGR